MSSAPRRAPSSIEARGELARLSDAVAKDPLAATPEQLATLETDVAAVRDRVERLRDLRGDTEPRLERARDLLAEARRAVEDAHEAHAAAIEKIAEPAVPAPAPIPVDLADELDQAAGLVRSGAWQEGGAAAGALARARHGRSVKRRDGSRQPTARRSCSATNCGGAWAPSRRRPSAYGCSKIPGSRRCTREPSASCTPRRPI